MPANPSATPTAVRFPWHIQDNTTHVRLVVQYAIDSRIALDFQGIVRLQALVDAYTTEGQARRVAWTR